MPDQVSAPQPVSRDALVSREPETSMPERSKARFLIVVCY